MDVFEAKEVLKSFRVIVDTREQPTTQALKRYKSMGVAYERHALDYGDYTFNLDFPDGAFLVGDRALQGHTVIERKMDLDELAMCLGRERKRFQREMERAKAAKAKVVLLVEDATWENLINGKYRSKMNAKAFYSSLVAWMIRYDLAVVFCKSETSGKLIKEILYRAAKEMVEGMIDVD